MIVVYITYIMGESNLVYSIERLADEPIIVITATLPTDAYRDVRRKLDDLEAMVQTMDDPVIFRINDYSAIPAPTLDDITFVLAEETRSARPGSAADPRIRCVLVDNQPMIKLAAEGAKQAQFGSLHLPRFDTAAAALAYVRAELERFQTKTENE